MRRSLCITALLVTLASAQSVPDRFEVASITPLQSGAGLFRFTLLPNRLDVVNLPLGYLIERAYDVPGFQLTGPEAVLGHRFDIQATSGGAVSRAEMLIMLRNLLGERFHLQTHWETRTESAYRMVVMPGGPKMKTSEIGYAGGNSPMRDGNSIQLNGPMSMRQLAESLNRFLHKPVVDGTNLDGYFTIALTFAAEDLDAPKDLSLPLPYLPQALEQQMGLKLVAVKEPIQHLVVDHADAVPTRN